MSAGREASRRPGGGPGADREPARETGRGAADEDGHEVGQDTEPDAERGVERGGERGMAQDDRRDDARDDGHEVPPGVDPSVDWERALRDATQDMADDPRDRHAELRRIQAVLALGHHGAAAAMLRAYLARVPDDPRAWDFLAATQLYRGRHREAEASATRALASDPDYHPARYNRACARARQGALDGALEDLRAAIVADEDLRAMAREDPDLAALRADPRSGALLGETGPG